MDTWSHLPISWRPASVKLKKPVLLNLMLNAEKYFRVSRRISTCEQAAKQFKDKSFKAPANNCHSLRQHVLPLVLIVHINADQNRNRSLRRYKSVRDFITLTRTRHILDVCESSQERWYFLDREHPKHLPGPPLYKSPIFQFAWDDNFQGGSTQSWRTQDSDFGQKQTTAINDSAT